MGLLYISTRQKEVATVEFNDKILAWIFDGADPLTGEIPSDRDMTVTSDPHVREEAE